VLLVIFGAGASYDSVLHLPPDPPRSRTGRSTLPEHFRPPLANQLFDDREVFAERMEAYPACKPLVNLLRGDVQVERQLASFEEEAKTFPVRRRQLAAIRYYLHEILWRCQDNWRSQHRGITNYLTFLDEINRWRYENNERVCFVTFNYDTMLEESIVDIWRWHFAELDAYISHPQFNVIKLHGSIDWGLGLNSFVGRGAPNEVIEDAIRSLDVSDKYGKVELGMRFGDGTFGFPALAIPVEKKSEFACPPRHVQALAEVVPHIKKIITIGWRATEQHFLTMLKKPLTGLQGDVDLMVVSGDERGTRETVNNLAIGTPATERKRALRSDGFSGLIKQIGHLKAFLQ
jgi:hypothetical protein